MDKEKRVLLKTLSNANDLEQVLSTYSLYQFLTEQGFLCFVDVPDNFQSMSVRNFIEKYCGDASCRNDYGCIDAIVNGSGDNWKIDSQLDIKDKFLENYPDDIIKVAYSIGFGEECEYPIGMKNEAYFDMKNFRGISISDENALRIMNEEFKVNAEWVCPPILLNEKMNFEETRKEEGLFIFSYFLDLDKQKEKVINLAEESLKYRVANYKGLEEDGCTVEDYIDIVRKASLIITDSPTIVQLALVMGKPFVCVLSKNKKISYEVISILKPLNLEGRIIYIEDDVKEKRYLFRKPIKYGLVDYKVQELREKSKEWLVSCFE